MMHPTDYTQGTWDGRIYLNNGFDFSDEALQLQILVHELQHFMGWDDDTHTATGLSLTESATCRQIVYDY